MKSFIRILPLVMLSTALLPQAAEYPASKHGGNYMLNYYFPPAPSTTPWAPAWSPDGKSIAIAMQGSIWRVDPANGSAIELTYSRKYHSSPAWSPDGKWIVFSSSRKGWKEEAMLLDNGPQPYGELFAMHADGSDVRQLTDNQWEDATAAWLPRVHVQSSEARPAAR